MKTDQIQYSDKYSDDKFEYRASYSFIQTYKTRTRDQHLDSINFYIFLNYFLWFLYIFFLYFLN
ncbi:hypothetical protein Anas_09388 [Armadillidium nasatum]|uniref:Uncharacterized protein n=1 Tax=Armadillidium nasatum TaxID=96803 RepID=A0A5N5T3P3_9CRUS|nr:hypothetical protein Anas_09388 [Armadillidium nasatum]